MAFPAGWRVEIDPAARRTDGGRVLVGGSPLRIWRLTASGARLLDRLADGEPVPDAATARHLVRRLVDAGVAHPRPPVPPTGHAAGDVAVVVPTHDRADGLRRTLATIGEVGSVVVVDDGSRAPVGDVGVPVVRHDRPRGPAAAREAGWRRCGQPVVAFVDADVELPGGWLAPLLAHLDDPAVGAVAPRVAAAPDRAPRWLAAYEAVRSPLDLGPMPSPVRPGTRVPYVPTAALVVRRDALESVGGFDTTLDVGEDVDLVWRLHRAGWRVRYEPAVVARHPCRPGLRAWARQRFLYGTSAAPLTERHPGSVAPLQVSGWSAAAWGLAVAGHPLAGTAVAGATTAALAPKLRTLGRPLAEAVRIAGLGHLYAGRSVADALRRPWWPAAAVLGWLAPRTRPVLLAAAIVPAALDWRQEQPPAPLGPLAYGALRLADDLAYGAGVWAGCVRARSFDALAPRFTGPLPPPGRT